MLLLRLSEKSEALIVAFLDVGDGKSAALLL
jgi:hypothetical protein